MEYKDINEEWERFKKTLPKDSDLKFLERIWMRGYQQGFDNISDLPKISRLEVISDQGRQYVNGNVKDCQQSYQDGGRTLKLFVK